MNVLNLRQIYNIRLNSIPLIKLFFAVIFISFLTPCFTQNYEFYGVLKLNGSEKNAITYKIVFTETNGIVKGYSITDITGDHETKNLIQGSYDEKTKMLKISEKDIVYTKSAISEDLFCFVNFECKIKLVSDKAKINGNFKGLFKNKKKCIDGTLEMIGSPAVQKLMARLNKQIQKSKDITDADKVKLNPQTMFDSLQTNQMVAKQNLNIFMNSPKIQFEIWDNGLEDGDMIHLYHNGKIILDNYKVTLKKKILDVQLNDDKNEFIIEALNQGLKGKNTAMVKVIGDRSVDFQTNLDTGEKTKVTILKPAMN